MYVWMIWVEEDGTTWLDTAMDDDTLDINQNTWQKAVDRAEKSYPGKVRVVKTLVDFHAIIQAFQPPLIPSAPIEVVEP
jgi:hypothetical protein